MRERIAGVAVCLSPAERRGDKQAAAGEKKKETKTNDMYIYYTRHLVCAIQTQKQLVKAQGTNPSFLTGGKTNERP